MNRLRCACNRSVTCSHHRKVKVSNVKLIPINNFVVVEPKMKAETTPGGLFIPPTAQEKSGAAKVLAVSEKVYTVRENDTVIYDKFAGVEVEVGDSKVLILRETDIYAILS